MSTAIESIVDYFKSGIKTSDEPGRLGVELEHIIVDESTQAVPYDGANGIENLLKEMAADYDMQSYGEDGHLIGLSRERAAITLEPAAQLELSAGPYEEIGLIRYEFEEFHRDLAKLLDTHKQRAYLVGYQPASKADNLKLIPKARYHFMDEHFAAIGPYGRFMMRGSASTQLSIDFYSVEDCLRKLRLTSGLSPLFALLCDNTAIFEGEPSPHQLMRTEIWRECDPDRCGIVPGVMDKNFTLEDYAAYILNTPAIYKKTDSGTKVKTDQTFGDLFAHSPMEIEDIEFALSMMFNDVRLKTYIEIRTADAVPDPFIAAYAALVKGLFYSDANLDALDNLLDGITEDDIAEAKISLMNDGYNAIVYGKSAAEIIDTLFSLAYEGLAKNEKAYLSPLRQLATSRKTLAQMGRKNA